MDTRPADSVRKSSVQMSLPPVASDGLVTRSAGIVAVGSARASAGPEPAPRRLRSRKHLRADNRQNLSAMQLDSLVANTENPKKEQRPVSRNANPIIQHSQTPKFVNDATVDPYSIKTPEPRFGDERVGSGGLGHRVAPAAEVHCGRSRKSGFGEEHVSPSVPLDHLRSGDHWHHDSGWRSESCRTASISGMTRQTDDSQQGDRTNITHQHVHASSGHPSSLRLSGIEQSTPWYSSPSSARNISSSPSSTIHRSSPPRHHGTISSPGTSSVTARSPVRAPEHLIRWLQNGQQIHPGLWEVGDHQTFATSGETSASPSRSAANASIDSKAIELRRSLSRKRVLIQQQQHSDPNAQSAQQHSGDASTPFIHFDIVRRSITDFSDLENLVDEWFSMGSDASHRQSMVRTAPNRNSSSSPPQNTQPSRSSPLRKTAFTTTSDVTTPSASPKRLVPGNDMPPNKELPPSAEVGPTELRISTSTPSRPTRTPASVMESPIVATTTLIPSESPITLPITPSRDLSSGSRLHDSELGSASPRVEVHLRALVNHHSVQVSHAVPLPHEGEIWAVHEGEGVSVDVVQDVEEDLGENPSASIASAYPGTNEPGLLRSESSFIESHVSDSVHPSYSESAFSHSLMFHSEVDASQLNLYPRPRERLGDSPATQNLSDATTDIDTATTLGSLSRASESSRSSWSRSSFGGTLTIGSGGDDKNVLHAPTVSSNLSPTLVAHGSITNISGDIGRYAEARSTSDGPDTNTDDGSGKEIAKVHDWNPLAGPTEAGHASGNGTDEELDGEQTGDEGDVSRYAALRALHIADDATENPEFRLGRLNPATEEQIYTLSFRKLEQFSRPVCQRVCITRFMLYLLDVHPGVDMYLTEWNWPSTGLATSGAGENEDDEDITEEFTWQVPESVVTSEEIHVVSSLNEKTPVARHGPGSYGYIEEFDSADPSSSGFEFQEVDPDSASKTYFNFDISIRKDDGDLHRQTNSDLPSNSFESNPEPDNLDLAEQPKQLIIRKNRRRYIPGVPFIMESSPLAQSVVVAGEEVDEYLTDNSDIRAQGTFGTAGRRRRVPPLNGSKDEWDVWAEFVLGRATPYSSLVPKDGSSGVQDDTANAASSSSEPALRSIWVPTLTPLTGTGPVNDEDQRSTVSIGDTNSSNGDANSFSKKLKKTPSAYSLLRLGQVVSRIKSVARRQSFSVASAVSVTDSASSRYSSPAESPREESGGHAALPADNVDSDRSSVSDVVRQPIPLENERPESEGILLFSMQSERGTHRLSKDVGSTSGPWASASFDISRNHRMSIGSAEGRRVRDATRRMSSSSAGASLGRTSTSTLSRGSGRRGRRKIFWKRRMGGPLLVNTDKTDNRRTSMTTLRPFGTGQRNSSRRSKWGSSRAAASMDKLLQRFGMGGDRSDHREEHGNEFGWEVDEEGNALDVEGAAASTTIGIPRRKSRKFRPEGGVGDAPRRFRFWKSW